MSSSLNNTIEELENEYWGVPAKNSTTLVSRIHELRKKPLKDFTIEDLRIVIGQSFSLGLLIPLAIEELKQNILAEGDFFEGDLLINVLNADVNYWKLHHNQWLIIKALVEANKALFEEKKHRQILKGFKKFEQVYTIK